MNKWDEYYLRMCKEVASNSSCFSRKIGAILVNDKSIVSTGYNGPPRGIDPCDQRWGIDKCLPSVPHGFEMYAYEDDPKAIRGKCPRYVLDFKSGQGLGICIAGHAERNALINAARNGIPTKGTKMYMDCGIPCKDCLVEIINAGISEMIVTKLTYYDDASEYLVKQSGIKVRTYEGEELNV